ncbi:hypothetical protein GCM10025782_23960 [Pedococcus ginsenosidimutans]|uniref:Secreted protein n=1 Tax=Pedococcus ginsenosidimutans TaxID=490570 RepID=A0ABP8YBE0_9MICO
MHGHHDPLVLLWADPVPEETPETALNPLEAEEPELLEPELEPELELPEVDPVELAVVVPWSCARWMPTAPAPSVEASRTPAVQRRARLRGLRGVLIGSVPSRGLLSCFDTRVAPCAVPVRRLRTPSGTDVCLL